MANNFRDVLGGLYNTASGQRMRTGTFYRSSALALTSIDTPTWKQLGVRAVYDLRTPAEIKNQPNELPNDIAYQPINVLGMDNVVFGSLSSKRETVTFMEDLQRKMVTDANMRRGFGHVLTQLAQAPGAQLYHCSAGKDRTGWLSVLLLSHAGVTQADIMQDYLLSNQYLKAFVETTHEAVAKRFGQIAAQAIQPALTVQESFLQAGLEQLSQSYGSVDQYLQQGLGLTPLVLEQLHHKLLEQPTD